MGGITFYLASWMAFKRSNSDPASEDEVAVYVCDYICI